MGRVRPQLLDKLGVKINEIKSGPLKANPSPFQPLDEAGTARGRADGGRIQALVRGPGAHPARHRHRRAWPGLEQGRVFSGREALAHKLIDQIGGEAEAVKYLEEKRNVPKGLKVDRLEAEAGQRLGPHAAVARGRWHA